MSKFPQIILAIESAIAGGSLSLLRDGEEIANWTGTSNVSKAEDLLANIDTILTETSVSRHDIDLIAVSAGPGSFTGIRIGIATALGLKAGLGVEMSSESALKAIAFSQPISNNILITLPVGRNAVCVQRFSRTERGAIALSEPHTITEDEFVSLSANEKNASLVLHPSLYKQVTPAANIVNWETNIARSIGLLCSENPDVVIEPLFISKSF